jgi:XTP/dITP diphosphohydrolase
MLDIVVSYTDSMPDFDVDALFYAGLDALAAGDVPSAIEALRKASGAGHRDAKHGLIRALDVAGRYDEALAVSQALIAEAPNDVLARTSLSMIYQHMGMVPEAEKAALDAKLLDWKMQLKQGTGGDAVSFGFGAVERIYVATTNAGKLRDFETASGGRVRLEPLPGLKEIPPPSEDEPTFEGNAAVKAKFYSLLAPGEIVLADDSGLEVDALNGAPGVRSARYAEDMGFNTGGTPDERNNLCLLVALEGKGQRTGRYRCALAAARDGVVLWTGEGSVEGSILTAPRGTGGFGYDPLFLIAERGLTMSEMGAEERLDLSHRGKALRALLSASADFRTE